MFIRTLDWRLREFTWVYFRSKMELFMMVNGSLDFVLVKVNRSGKMGAFMRGIGKTIKLTVSGD